MMKITELLQAMTQIPAPSGCEEKIRAYIRDYAEKYCDEVKSDAMGNLIAHQKGGGKKIMFAAHMDEIGVIVTGINEKGFLNFARIGGLNLKNLVNLRIRLMNGIEGVIGADEDAFHDKPSYDKLFIDIGARGKADAERMASAGDAGVFVSPFTQNGRTVISKVIDNRAGCAALMAAMAETADSGNDLYYVFTVQEEVGLRGARAAAFELEPDIAVSVDTTDTGDVPGAAKMAVEMGKGAAVKVMDRSVICDPYVRLRLIELAKEKGIPYQLEIMTDGGTDAGAIQLTRAGVRTGGISVPTRYIHSVSEMADISDIENTARLVAEAARTEW